MFDGDGESLCTVTVEDATIRAVDRANSVVEIETVGWDRPAPEASIPYPMDASIAGRATRLELTSTNVTVATLLPDGGIDDRTQLDANDRRTVTGDESGLLVWVTGPINTWILFDGAAEIAQSAERTLTISFPHPTAVTVGFQSNVDAPSHAVTVEPTPAGVATALSYFGATIPETSPTRTSSLCRGHPPRIVFGDEDVPEALRTAAIDTGIELVLPATFDALFPAASLAAYLGARVRVADGVAPTLRIPEYDFAHEFAAPPAFQHEAAGSLRRVFWLDALARWAEQTDFDWLEADAMPAVALDTAELATLPLADRVRRYLSVDFERVSPLFPEWIHDVYVEPSAENARVLPSLANNLSQVYLPDARPDRSSPGTDGVSSTDRPTAGAGGESATDTPSGPRPRTRGPYVGWLGDDPLADAYRTSLAAYRNREAYLGERDDLSVLVVPAGANRADRFDQLLTEYRVDRPAIDLTVVESPARDELADRLADGVDLLHVVGDCRDGLPCADGSLSPAAVERGSVRTFFLDGPGADEAADGLIESGSVAGAALSGPADDAALDPVRRRFLRGFVGGFTVELAARYARELHDGAAPLSVVGDGIHELADLDVLQVFPLEVEPVENRQFRVRISTLYADPGTAFGGLSLERWQLGGNPFDLTLSAGGLATLLDTSWYLVIADGELYRPDAVEPFAPSF